MFLATILVCQVGGACTFKSLEYAFPNKFVCEQAVNDGVDHFNLLPQVEYAEGRCIRWGNLVEQKT